MYAYEHVCIEILGCWMIGRLSLSCFPIVYDAVDSIRKKIQLRFREGGEWGAMGGKVTK